ncbi:glycosyltransferase family 61 protein [Roseovarius sp. A21]|uniref:Glycosyltransferase family 61 protein n=1 Tax=Roseovarius bejariae TaxID=2576383 RepID=A0A844CUZ5_9RHOB|nr:glycosyltransferase 61 family protein [Roseovarius bejariae]MRU15006.1 glycosyltransferase family 61 protein [Roseovarius bejariae]
MADPQGPPPDAQVETLRDATVVPMAEGRDQACGVLRADGSFCDISATRLSAGRITGTPAAPDSTTPLPGRHLYAGLGRHHFGHFLVETITRLWALDAQAKDCDGIVVIPKHGIDFNAVMRRRLGAFLDLLSGGLPVHIATTPLTVETLHVPTQGIGHMSWLTATPEFRHYVRQRLTAQITPKGPEKLYISRTGLKDAAQAMDQEARVETVMKNAGYTIFHPQNHSLPVQCSRYMAAKQIVGPDGSAFHLAPFVLQKGTRVGLIQRRHRQDVFDALTAQIRAFCEAELVTFNPLLPPDNPARPDTPQMFFPWLKRGLRRSGFL